MLQNEAGSNHEIAKEPTVIFPCDSDKGIGTGGWIPDDLFINYYIIDAIFIIDIILSKSVI